MPKLRLKLTFDQLEDAALIAGIMRLLADARNGVSVNPASGSGGDLVSKYTIAHNPEKVKRARRTKAEMEATRNVVREYAATPLTPSETITPAPEEPVMNASNTEVASQLLSEHPPELTEAQRIAQELEEDLHGVVTFTASEQEDITSLLNNPAYTAYSYLCSHRAFAERHGQAALAKTRKDLAIGDDYDVTKEQMARHHVYMLRIDKGGVTD